MGSKQTREEHYYTERPTSTPRLGIIRVQLRGRTFEFLTSSSVFSKRRLDPGTRLLIEAMVIPEDGDMLDLGCGYGPVGIVAATLRHSSHAIMTDTNKRAVWLARQNVKRNHVDNVEVRHGSLYEPVKPIKFDTILTNPPVSVGMQIVLQIIKEAPTYLKKDGLLQLVVQSRIGGRRLVNELENRFGNVTVTSRKGGYRVLLSRKS